MQQPKLSKMTATCKGKYMIPVPDHHVEASQARIIVRRTREGWRAMEIVRAHQHMMGSGMMFSEIISTIQTPFFPVYKKLALANPIAYPVITHIHSFGAFLSDGIIGNATGSAIIGDNTGRRLGMTKLNKNVANSICLFAMIVEQSS